MKKILVWTLLVILLVGLLLLGTPSQRWHATHSNHIDFQSHSVYVPLSWKASTPMTSDSIELLKQPFIGSQGSVEFVAKGPSLTQNAIDLWREKKIQMQQYDRNAANHPFTPQVIKTPTLSFDCLSEIDNGSSLMFCRALNTNWQVSVMGNEKILVDVRKILEGVE